MDTLKHTVDNIVNHIVNYIVHQGINQLYNLSSINYTVNHRQVQKKS